MVETRPDRHGLMQWSSGGDSGSRLDFNEAFGKLNANAPYDDGDTLTELPVTNLVDARYVLVALTGGFRTLYRRSDTSSWDPVGGNTMPRAYNLRALEAQARTATALTISHPDHVSGATFGYDGSATLTGTVRVHDAEDVARGAVMIGTTASVGLTTLGRLHVRTRATGERGIVLRPYSAIDPDVGSGNLFTAQSAGGSDVVSIDALGRLRVVPPSAFGGAALSTAAVTVAPSSADDAQTTGVLLYGQVSDPASAKSIVQVWRDVAETAPLVNISRNTIAIGRLPWVSPRTSGQAIFAANAFQFRASGDPVNTSWWTLRTSDATNPTTEANPVLDTVQLSASNAGFGFRMPIYVSQRNRQELPTLTVLRVGDFNAGFMEFARLVPDGLGGETPQAAAFWASDGRLRTGAWWLTGGIGTTREARQSLTHVCTKRFTPIDGDNYSGQFVANNAAFNYQWPEMVPKSSGPTDLDITLTSELMMTQTDGQADAQAVNVEMQISIDGGPFTQIAVNQIAPVSTPLGKRAGGAVLVSNFRVIDAIAASTPFRLRTRLIVGNSNTLGVWIKMFDVKVAEALVMSYTAA
jgi:hypothetical protein